MSYLVEILNLGKRPLAGVTPSVEVFDDARTAADRHCWAVGEMVMRDGMVMQTADRRAETAEDGILAAAALTHATDGGRIEILLRHRPDPASALDPDRGAVGVRVGDGQRGLG